MSKGLNEGFRESGSGRHDFKIGGFRNSGSGSYESKNGDELGKTVQATAGEMEASIQNEGEKRSSWGGRVNLEGWERFEKPEKKGHVAQSERGAASHHSGCDNLSAEKQEESKGKETCSTQRQTKSHLVGDLSKTKDEEKASWVGLVGEPNLKEVGATSPLKLKINMLEQKEVSSLKPKITKKNNTEEEGQAGPNKGKSGTGKGNLKKVAREVGKAQGAGLKSLEIVVGTKRCEDTDTLVEREGRP